MATRYGHSPEVLVVVGADLAQNRRTKRCAGHPVATTRAGQLRLRPRHQPCLRIVHGVSPNVKPPANVRVLLGYREHAFSIAITDAPAPYK